MNACQQHKDAIFHHAIPPFDYSEIPRKLSMGKVSEYAIAEDVQHISRLEYYDCVVSQA
jgi:hypothetical protein